MRRMRPLPGSGIPVHLKVADQRVEIAARMNTMLAQPLVECISIKGIGGLDQDGEIRVVGLGDTIDDTRADAGYIGQPCSVTLAALPACLDSLVDMPELQQAEGSIDFAHFAVDTGLDHGRFVDESEIFQTVDMLLSCCVVADDRAPFEGIENFGRMETEHTEVAMSQYAAAGVLDAKGMGRVIDDFQPVAVGNRLDGRRVAWNTVAVYRQDRRCTFGNGGFDPCRVEVESGRIHVYKDGREAIPEQGVGGGDEGIRGSDDFALYTQCLQRCKQGSGAITEQCNVIDAQVFAQRLF